MKPKIIFFNPARLKVYTLQETNQDSWSFDQEKDIYELHDVYFSSSNTEPTVIEKKVNPD